MPRTVPAFGSDVSDECMERIIEFVLHYEFELKQERVSNGRLTTHQKSQMALVRRMLLDLGVSAWAVYGDESPPD
jgi:hypothetical protein